MDIKDFLRLSLGRIILLIIIFLLSSILPAIGSFDHVTFGLPFTFAASFGPTPSQQTGHNYFSFPYLIIDLIVIYLISCAIVSVYRGIRNRK